MASDVRTGSPPHYKCVGIGIGPANLSLASLLSSHPQIPNLFIEKRQDFGWHDSQQLAGTSLQVSTIKDLVTLSDPTNSLTFLAYLHAHGRLYHYINAQFEAVPRREFRNYLKWVSKKNKNLTFGEEVTSVDFDREFTVQTDRGTTVTADNVVVGVGSVPWYPEHVRDGIGRHQFHVSDFLTRARNLGGKRVVVVGGGQSGAEAFLDLISRSGRELPQRVTWVSRRGNFFPIDDSPFTNDYFMPSFSDYFSSLDQVTRERFTREQVLASDGISESTLREIYQRAYVHRFVEGKADLFALYPNRDVTQVTGTTELDVTIAHNDFPDTAEHIATDFVIWATGYRPARMDFLAPIGRRLDREGREYRIDDSFAMVWDGPPDRNIFVQNAARQQRGLADPNLSLMAWRSQRILDRIRGVRTENQAPPFIEWSAKEPSTPQGLGSVGE